MNDMAVRTWPLPAAVPAATAEDTFERCAALLAKLSPRDQVAVVNRLFRSLPTV